MRINPSPEPITDSDAAIHAAVRAADVAPLLASVAALTGDYSVLVDELRPDPLRNLEPKAGFSADDEEYAATLATRALAGYRDRGNVAGSAPSAGNLRRLIEFVTGSDLDDDYFELLSEELALGGQDLRAPRWHISDFDVDAAECPVVVIGAGMSGIVAAHRLQQAGVSVRILEKNSGIGGTWWENTYPGCRVDVPNHLYSYSFAQTPDWPHFYSTQPALQEYFAGSFDAVGLAAITEFNAEVLAADWDDVACVWRLQVRRSDPAIGVSDSEVVARVVVCAVGQLNRPVVPPLEGRDNFAGPAFHSARWPEALDLTGLRVGVIGTGASAAQLIPEVAKQASELTIYQRTPAWLLPTPDYHDEIPAGLRWMGRHVPEYSHWDRLWLFWRTHEGLLPLAQADPDWDGAPASTSALNELLRQLFVAYLRAEFPDPELFAKLEPHYPPAAKRFLRDNGIWAKTLARRNVELVTAGIERVEADGIRDVEGTRRAHDVLVYATGFSASSFLVPMQVRGRRGVDLHQQWDGDARAYLGMTIPGFPNMFLMYGPNTNIVVNGSIIYFSECETNYIVDAVRQVITSRLAAYDCRAEVHDAYNEWVDVGNAGRAWGAASVNTWYRNAKGRISQNWPYSLREFWTRTRRFVAADYEEIRPSR